MRTSVVIAVVASFSLVPSVARAQQAGTGEASAGNVVAVALKAGLGFPQINSSFGTAPLVQLEGSYLLPFFEGRVGACTALAYAAPSLSGTGEDARLPGGTYSYEATQRQLNWDLGVLAKLNPWNSPWNAGALAGLRLTFQSTLTDGEAGIEAFGEHDERATLAGLFLAFQGEYRLGPGAVVGEAGYWASFQDLRTTGELVISEITILAGYRFAFAL
jgi:hypothetical protein